MATPRVKTARQRFKMVPKLDASGVQVRTPVIGRNGEQRKTRAGKPIFRDVTVADKNQPLPPRKCERDGKELAVGQKYRSVAIKAGYGSIKRYRCMECPQWEPWELSNSLASRIMQIQQETIDLTGVEDEDGIRDAVSPIVEMIRELAEEKETSAQNMEDGFGHATAQSEEIAEQAQGLNEWADELENFSPPDDKPEGKCGNCDGQGDLECSTHEEKDHDEDCDGTEECVECGGSGEGEDIGQQEMDDWLESCQNELQGILDNCPVG